MICDECETVAHCMKNGCVPVQPQQEPVLMFYEQEWQGKTSRAYRWLIDPFSLPTGSKLYTSPPAQRKPWVGLTDEERMDILLALNWDKQLTHMDTAKSIEAKLKDKNT